MPDLNRLFGIIIRMYWEASAPTTVHFHPYDQMKWLSKASILGICSAVEASAN